jgi:hypothetical protein
MSDIIGVRNNNTIVPYTAATKRTKEMTWTSSDVVVSGTSFSAWTISIAKGFAYADSTGKWRLFFSVRGIGTSGGVRTVATLTFANNAAVTFAAGATDYQPVTVSLETADETYSFGYTNPSAATIYIGHNSLSAAVYAVTADVALASKPAWADANMEGVLPVDVYIAPASGAAPGIVDQNAATWNGVKTFSDGVKLGGTSNQTLKMLSLTATSNAAEGGVTNVAHGLTGNNILGWNAKLLDASNSGVGPNWTVAAGYEYFVHQTNTNFVITNHATNSENILSKTVYIVVWYQ